MLRDRRTSLFIHPCIHLKLLVFNSGRAFHTSGNITSRGLGFQSNQNIEVGCIIQLSASDWRLLYRPLEESHLVDDAMYEPAKNYVQEYKRTSLPLPRLDLIPAERREFSFLSLPAYSSPLRLYDYYIGEQCDKTQPDNIASCIHDLALYGIDEGMSYNAFIDHLRAEF